jgi:hypothetical protein
MRQPFFVLRLDIGPTEQGRSNVPPVHSRVNSATMPRFLPEGSSRRRWLVLAISTALFFTCCFAIFRLHDSGESNLVSVEHHVHSFFKNICDLYVCSTVEVDPAAMKVNTFSRASQVIKNQKPSVRSGESHAARTNAKFGLHDDVAFRRAEALHRQDLLKRQAQFLRYVNRGARYGQKVRK